jgi:hypothetical protein
MSEKYDIIPIIGEQQHLRTMRGNKYIDFSDGNVILSCRLDINDRTGFNSAFNGNTFVFYFGMENIYLPILEFDERNIEVFGQHEEFENWIPIRRYLANETYTIWENGKNIMWTLEGQMNYQRQLLELRDVLLYSNSIYKGRSYGGLVKADFNNFRKIKIILLVNKNSLDELEVEYVFEINRIN